jgi:hypothetical protein
MKRLLRAAAYGFFGEAMAPVRPEIGALITAGFVVIDLFNRPSTGFYFVTYFPKLSEPRMARHPIGDQAMTDAERQRKRRERLRKASPPNRGAVKVTSSEDRQREEIIWPLERRPAEVASPRAPKGLAEASQALGYAQAEIKRLTQELRIARTEVLLRGDEIEKLKAKIVKLGPLDPNSEAARRIAALEKKMKTLVPAVVKTKIAKALTEQTTSPQNRLDALQAWNGLGLNNIGK